MSGDPLTVTSSGDPFQTIIENSLHEIFMFDAETLRFVFVNRGAAKNLGYTTAELLDRTPLDIKPEFQEVEFRQVIRPVLDGRENMRHRLLGIHAGQRSDFWVHVAANNFLG